MCVCALVCIECMFLRVDCCNNTTYYIDFLTLIKVFFSWQIKHINKLSYIKQLDTCLLLCRRPNVFSREIVFTEWVLPAFYNLFIYLANHCILHALMWMYLYIRWSLFACSSVEILCRDLVPFIMYGNLPVVCIVNNQENYRMLWIIYLKENFICFVQCNYFALFD